MSSWPAPDVVENGGHSVQAEAPALPYVPTEQSEHEKFPITSLNFPAGQSWHDIDALIPLSDLPKPMSQTHPLFESAPENELKFVPHSLHVLAP